LNNPIKYIDLEGLVESRFSIEGGGTLEDPEVTGDPSYDGNGQITIPTSAGDVTIDLDEENWGDFREKAKEKAIENERKKIRRMLIRRFLTYGVKQYIKNLKNKMINHFKANWECYFKTQCRLSVESGDDAGSSYYGCFEYECRMNNGEESCKFIQFYKTGVLSGDLGYLVYGEEGELTYYKASQCPCLSENDIYLT
jgi:hypothetical protein